MLKPCARARSVRCGAACVQRPVDSSRWPRRMSSASGGGRADAHQLFTAPVQLLADQAGATSEVDHPPGRSLRGIGEQPLSQLSRHLVAEFTNQVTVEPVCGLVEHMLNITGRRSVCLLSGNHGQLVTDLIVVGLQGQVMGLHLQGTAKAGLCVLLVLAFAEQGAEGVGILRSQLRSLLHGLQGFVQPTLAVQAHSQRFPGQGRGWVALRVELAACSNSFQWPAFIRAWSRSCSCCRLTGGEIDPRLMVKDWKGVFVVWVRRRKATCKAQRRRSPVPACCCVSNAR